jgi:hypothetical protein
VNLSGCQFYYGDAREAPESLRESVEAEVAGILGLVLPTGDCLFVAEISSDT